MVLEYVGEPPLLRVAPGGTCAPMPMPEPLARRAFADVFRVRRQAVGIRTSNRERNEIYTLNPLNPAPFFHFSDLLSKFEAHIVTLWRAAPALLFDALPFAVWESVGTCH